MELLVPVLRKFPHLLKKKKSAHQFKSHEARRKEGQRLTAYTAHAYRKDDMANLEKSIKLSVGPSLRSGEQSQQSALPQNSPKSRKRDEMARNVHAVKGRIED